MDGHGTGKKVNLGGCLPDIWQFGFVNHQEKMVGLPTGVGFNPLILLLQSGTVSDTGHLSQQVTVSGVQDVPK